MNFLKLNINLIKLSVRYKSAIFDWKTHGGALLLSLFIRVP